MTQLNGIKNYDRVRRYLECIYLYGFFSREDFERSGIGSAKDYDYVLRMIRATYPQVDELPQWHNGKKSLRVLRKYIEDGTDHLSDSYMLYALDMACDLPELLQLFSCLNLKAWDVTSLSARLEQFSQDEEGSKYATTRRRLLECADYGYAKKLGRKFCGVADPLDALSDVHLLQLYNYVAFCSATTYPRVAGSYLRRTLVRKLVQRHLTPPPTGTMILRQHNIGSIFDEDMLYLFLTLVSMRKQVTAMYRGSAVTLVPIALRIDTQLGRWYLLSMSVQGPLLCRISHLSKVKEIGVIGDEVWTAYQTEVCATFASAGCSGMIPEGEPFLIDATFHFGENRRMEEQFLRELRLGEIVEIDHVLHYQVYINDPIELVPLLRSYLPWIRIAPGSHQLTDYLYRDLKQMEYALQETINHATIS